MPFPFLLLDFGNVYDLNIVHFLTQAQTVRQYPCRINSGNTGDGTLYHLAADLSAVPMLHELSHLPVVVDPSHATGIAKLVTPMALAATAGGADGIMVEVHNDPAHALCDGAQSLTPPQFAELAEKVRRVREVTV